jgi:hypothetical protein
MSTSSATYRLNLVADKQNVVLLAEGMRLSQVSFLRNDDSIKISVAMFSQSYGSVPSFTLNRFDQECGNISSM